MESSHSSTPHAITPNAPTNEVTSSQTICGRPSDYDSSFENWLEEPKGASVPTRKGKGKYYQIISSSERGTCSQKSTRKRT